MGSKPTGNPRGRPKKTKLLAAARGRGRPRLGLRYNHDRLLIASFTALVASGVTERRAAILVALFSESREESAVAYLAQRAGEPRLASLLQDLVEACG